MATNFALRALPPLGTLISLDRDGNAVVHLDQTLARGHGRVEIGPIRLPAEERDRLNAVLDKVLNPSTAAQALAAAVLQGDEEGAARALADYLQENGFSG